MQQLIRLSKNRRLQPLFAWSKTCNPIQVVVCTNLYYFNSCSESDFPQLHENIIKKQNTKFNLSSSQSNYGELFGGHKSYCMWRKCCSFVGNSNSNWTFIALNLPYSKGGSKAQQNKNSQPISKSRDRKESKHHGECQG